MTTTTETLREACPTCGQVKCERLSLARMAEALRLRTLTTEAAAGTGGEPTDEEVERVAKVLHHAHLHIGWTPEQKELVWPPKHYEHEQWLAVARAVLAGTWRKP